MLVAGCGAGSDDGSRTVNPALAETPTFTATPAVTETYPPGTGPDGVDARVLAGRHDRALDRVNSTVHIEQRVVTANGTTLSATDIAVESAGPRVHYRVNETGGLPGEFVSPFPTFEFWTNGSVTVTRAVNAAGDVTVRRIQGQPPTIGGTDDSGEEAVFGAVVGTDARVVGTATVDDEELFVVRADHDRLNRTGRVTYRNYSLVAYVTPEGVVRSYELQFTATYDTENGSVVATTTEQFRSSVGGSVATPPPWVVDATRSVGGEPDTADGESEPAQIGTGQSGRNTYT